MKRFLRRLTLCAFHSQRCIHSKVYEKEPPWLLRKLLGDRILEGESRHMSVTASFVPAGRQGVFEFFHASFQSLDFAVLLLENQMFDAVQAGLDPFEFLIHL
jgi:hypothetical protein